MKVSVPFGKDSLALEGIDDLVAVRRHDEVTMSRVSGLGREMVTGLHETTQRGSDLASLLVDQVEVGQLTAFFSAGIGFARAGGDAAALSAGRSQSPAIGRVLMSGEGRLYVTTTDVLLFLEDDDPDRLGSILKNHGLEARRRLPFANAVRCQVLDGKDPLDIANRLSDAKWLRRAEPVLLENIAQRTIPSDPRIQVQWFHNNTGLFGGTRGADIGSFRAWQTATGSGVRVAVIDNGFQASHPELQPRIHRLSGYFHSDPSGDSEFIVGTAGMPSSSHGTSCAGMVGAAANNSLHGCGVAFDSNMILIATLTDQVGSQDTLARAIAYAANPTTENPDADPVGADVISCSLGPSASADWRMQTILDEAIRFAAREGRSGRGCPIFWAVTNGNHRVSRDQVCSHPDVIGIGRSTNRDRQDGSGYGPGLDMLAPGVNVPIPVNPPRDFDYVTGTSFAAPCAAGVAALALECRPDLTAVALRDAMLSTCDKVGGVTYDSNGWHQHYGHGRVSAARLLEHLTGTARSASRRSRPTRAGRVSSLSS